MTLGSLALSVSHFYVGMIRRHPFVFAMVVGVLLFFGVLCASSQVRRQAGLAQLTALIIGALVIDATLGRESRPEDPIRVRYPRLELTAIAITWLAALTWLTLHFVVPHAETQPIAYWPQNPAGRVLAIGIGLASVFSLPALALLLFLGYRPYELGVRLRGFWAALLITLGFAFSTWMFVSPDARFVVLRQFGWTGWAPLILSAAAPEEFSRFVWQTRVTAMWRNRAAGWFVASTVWAVVHVPRIYAQIDTHSILDAFKYSIGFIPIGLLWGYLTIRARSILPSVVLHGTNIWGIT